MGEKSLFMQDNWGSNHGYEAMLDFQMSWLMRLSAEKSIDKPRLHQISKDVLLKLIEIDKEKVKKVEINEVKVWRQWASIDVVAEVDVLVDEKAEQHLVVIEDKAYTMLHNDQLARYKKIVCERYEGKRDIHYWVITFFDEGNPQRFELLRQDCKKNKWKLLSLYDVINWKEGFVPSESDLFNEFWLKEWY